MYLKNCINYIRKCFMNPSSCTYYMDLKCILFMNMATVTARSVQQRKAKSYSSGHVLHARAIIIIYLRIVV